MSIEDRVKTAEKLSRLLKVYRSGGEASLKRAVAEMINSGAKPKAQPTTPKSQPKSDSNTKHVDKIRGTIDVPLSPFGKEQVEKLGQNTAGQVDRIRTSPLKRAHDTAEAIAKTNPQAGPVIKDERLMPWHLGKYEGQPTDKVIHKINEFVTQRPDTKIPGRSPKSTEPGESFNQFKNPFLAHVIQELRDYEPGKKIVNVVHYRNIRVLEAWIKNGHPADLSVDTHMMVTKGDSDPADLFLLDPETMKLSKVKTAAKPGIYFARHGATALNAENEGKKEVGE